MTTEKILKEAKNKLDKDICKLLEEFINLHGNFHLVTTAHTYYSPEGKNDKMHAYSNTKIEI